MRAIRYSDYGTPDVLQPADLPTPVRRRGQVLIRVLAAGINPIDYRTRQGQLKWLLPGGFPRVPGYDVAGRVAECDQDSGLSVGDRVLAFLDAPRGGGYAEFAVASTPFVLPIPDELDAVAAGGLPLAGSTVLQAYRGTIVPGRGDAVLVNGASGGVGSLAVQIAKAYGASVTGVASGKHLDFVRELGADETIDYETTDFTGLGAQWQLVFDVAGNRTFSETRAALCERGTFVSTEPSFRGLIRHAATAFARQPAKIVLARPQRPILEELVRLVADGHLRVPVDRVYPLEEAAEAHRHLEAGGVRGKLVLRVADTDEQDS